MRPRFTTLSVMVKIAASALPLFFLTRILDGTFGENRREIVRLNALAERYEAEARERERQAETPHGHERMGSGYATTQLLQHAADYRRVSDERWQNPPFYDAFISTLIFVISPWTSFELFGAYLVAVIQRDPRKQAIRWNALYIGLPVLAIPVILIIFVILMSIIYPPSYGPMG